MNAFVTNRQIITESDVQRFFTMMKNERNAKLGQPHFYR
jgi:hypothetical protein